MVAEEREVIGRVGGVGEGFRVDDELLVALSDGLVERGVLALVQHPPAVHPASPGWPRQVTKRTLEVVIDDRIERDGVRLDA